MHATLAYLILDGPGDPPFHLKVCVFVPLISICISWALYRSKMPAWLLLAPAGITTLVVLSLISHGLTRSAMIEEFGLEYVAAIIASAALPMLAAFHFVSLRKKAADPVASANSGAEVDPESWTAGDGPHKPKRNSPTCPRNDASIVRR